jgi:hypothetical protein
VGNNIVHPKPSEHRSLRGWIRPKGVVCLGPGLALFSLRFETLCFLIACMGIVMSPSIGFALEGGLEVQNSAQSGIAGETEYNTNALRETVYLNQRFSLARRLTLEGDLRWQRDLTESGFSGLNQETDRRTNQGGLRLNYVTRPFSIGTRTHWMSRDYTGVGTLSPPRDRQEYQGWFKARPTERTLVWADLIRTIGHEEDFLGGDNETRETSGFLNLQQDWTGVGQFRYKLTGLSSNAVHRELREKQLSHRFEYLGAAKFAEDRAVASLRARSSFFNQTVETGRAGDSPFVLLPIAGGVLLDDTPETLDLLEDELTPVPELYDQDRATPTVINLGDSAEPVREIGGDYRNIQYDFGDTVEIVSASLYIDRQLLIPQLSAWTVYVTGDPEGRDWVALTPAEATVQYREWNTGVQGWEVTLAAGISGRYFKLVDVKFGPTVADLFVTELEVTSREVTTVQESTFRSEEHRLDGDISYDLTSVLRVGYQTTMRERISRGGGRDISERDHGLNSRWKVGDYTVSGQFRMDRIESGDRRTTDLKQYYLSAGRGFGSDFSTQVSWDRVDDLSRDLDRSTNTVSAIANWRAAPRLRLNQRVSYSTESTPGDTPGAESVVLMTSVQGSPVPSLTVDVDRSDRWVNRESGSGFRTFNDTGLQLSWSPVPLISLTSLVRYQRREEADWYVRNLASWSPLRSRKFDLQVSGNMFYDSRTESHENGVTVSTRWKPRNRLMIDGNIGWQRLDVAGMENTPVSTMIRVGWTF